jgi:hypothetical protein
MRWNRLAGAVAAMAVLGAGTAAAQGPGMGMRGQGGAMLAAPQIEELKTALHLDEEQEAKIKSLLTKYEADTKVPRETLQRTMQAMRDGSATETMRGESMGAMMVLREQNEELNKQIKALLREDQQKAFDDWLAARMPRRPGGGPPV